MTAQRDLDRMLGAWFGTEAAPAPPAEPLALVLKGTRAIRPRPSLIAGIGSNWIAGQSTRGLASGTFGLRRAVTIALVALLALALVGGAILVASRLLAPRLRTQHVYVDELVPAADLSMEMTTPVVVPLIDGRVLVIGAGDDGGGRPAAALVYDPATGASTTVGPFAEAQSWVNSAVRLLDGRVLIAGSSGPEIFDPASLRFASVGAMEVPREDFQMALLPDGQVLVAGGTLPGGGDLLTSAELFDSDTLTFAGTGDMAAAELHAYDAVASLPDGRVVLGGNQIQLYDPEHGAFAAAAWRPNYEPTDAVAIPDGRVVLLGSSGMSGNRVGHAHAWDPRSQTFSQLFVLRGVSIHEGILLDDGRIFLTGSTGPLAAARWAGIYDPATNETAEIAPTKAFWPTSVRLADGRVLVVGGLVDGYVRPDGGGVLAPAVGTVEIFQ